MKKVNGNINNKTLRMPEPNHNQIKICEVCQQPFHAVKSTTCFFAHNDAIKSITTKPAKGSGTSKDSLPQTAVASHCETIQNEEAKPEIHALPGYLGADNANDLIPVKEAARRLEVCKQTIYNLISDGTINLVRLTSRLSYIRRSQLLAMHDNPNPVPALHSKTPAVRLTKNPEQQATSIMPEEWINISDASNLYGVSNSIEYNYKNFFAINSFL